MEHGIREEFRQVHNQLKDTALYQGNNEAWKAKMESTVADPAASIQKKDGMLPSQTDPNPKNQIAPMELRSGLKMQGRGSGSKKKVQCANPITEQLVSPDVGATSADTSTQKSSSDEDQPISPDMESTSGDIGQQNLNFSRSDPEVPQPSPGASPTLPLLHHKEKVNTDLKFEKFVKVLRGMNVSIPFTDALNEMPSYAKFLKEVLAKKRTIPEQVNECNFVSIPSHDMYAANSPVKLSDPERFAITIGLGNSRYKALCDLGASTSLMPLDIWRDIRIGDLQPVSMKLYMADGSCTNPTGRMEDVVVQVGKFFVSTDFVVMDIPPDMSVPIILGWPFLATAGAKIDVQAGKMSLTIGEEEIEFHFNKTMSGPIQESIVEIVPTYKEPPREEVHKLDEVPEKKELTEEEMEKELPGFLPRKKKEYVIEEGADRGRDVIGELTEEEMEKELEGRSTSP